MEVAHPTDINFNLSYSPVMQCKKNSGSRSKRSVCSIRMPPYNKPVLKNSYFITRKSPMFILIVFIYSIMHVMHDWQVFMFTVYLQADLPV